MSDILTVDKGSPVLIEVEFFQVTPFGSDAYIDPTTYTYSVKDQTGTEKAAGNLVTSGTTGKWYVVVQSTTSWSLGLYSVTITATSGSYTDVTTEYNFKLE